MGAAEEIRGTEVPRLEGEFERVVQRPDPRDSGRDLRADVEAVDAERGGDGPRGLAAGDDEAAETGRGQLPGETTEQPFDRGCGLGRTIGVLQTAFVPMRSKGALLFLAMKFSAYGAMFCRRGQGFAPLGAKKLRQFLFSSAQKHVGVPHKRATLKRVFFILYGNFLPLPGKFSRRSSGFPCGTPGNR